MPFKNLKNSAAILVKKHQKILSSLAARSILSLHFVQIVLYNEKFCNKKNIDLYNPNKNHIEDGSWLFSCEHISTPRNSLSLILQCYTLGSKSNGLLRLLCIVHEENETLRTLINSTKIVSANRAI